MGRKRTEQRWIWEVRAAELSEPLLSLPPLGVHLSQGQLPEKDLEHAPKGSYPLSPEFFVL